MTDLTDKRVFGEDIIDMFGTIGLIELIESITDTRYTHRHSENNGCENRIVFNHFRSL
jgi:hypothetical protein